MDEQHSPPADTPVDPQAYPQAGPQREAPRTHEPLDSHLQGRSSPRQHIHDISSQAKQTECNQCSRLCQSSQQPKSSYKRDTPIQYQVMIRTCQDQPSHLKKDNQVFKLHEERPEDTLSHILALQGKQDSLLITAIERHVELRLQPKPRTHIGKYLLQNGSFAIIYIRLATKLVPNVRARRFMAKFLLMFFEDEVTTERQEFIRRRMEILSEFEVTTDKRKRRAGASGEKMFVQQQYAGPQINGKSINASYGSGSERQKSSEDSHFFSNSGRRPNGQKQNVTNSAIDSLKEKHSKASKSKNKSKDQGKNKSKDQGKNKSKDQGKNKSKDQGKDQERPFWHPTGVYKAPDRLSNHKAITLKPIIRRSPHRGLRPFSKSKHSSLQSQSPLGSRYKYRLLQRRNSTKKELIQVRASLRIEEKGGKQSVDNSNRSKSKSKSKRQKQEDSENEEMLRVDYLKDHLKQIEVKKVFLDCSFSAMHTEDGNITQFLRRLQDQEDTASPQRNEAETEAQVEGEAEADIPEEQANKSITHSIRKTLKKEESELPLAIKRVVDPNINGHGIYALLELGRITEFELKAQFAITPLTNLAYAKKSWILQDHKAALLFNDNLAYVPLNKHILKMLTEFRQ